MAENQAQIVGFAVTTEIPRPNEFNDGFYVPQNRASAL
jgi:hypothetical protein